ncbi:MAG: ATP-binding protein [Myxococcales bacterium]|nr:ATP-binding protein [Myxococcales bacterium]
MVLRFLLENYASFRDEVEVSFVSTSPQGKPAWRFESPHVAHGVLPAVGVWGANASGKSNLLRGMTALRHLVKSSFVDFGPTDPVPWTPFRLDRSADAPATRMEIDFTIGDVRFQLGVRLDGLGFAEEWLYRWGDEPSAGALPPPAGRGFLLWALSEGTARPDRGADPRQQSLPVGGGSAQPRAAAAGHEALVQGIQVEQHVRLRGFPLFHPSHPCSLRPTRAAPAAPPGCRRRHRGCPGRAARRSAHADRGRLHLQADFLARLREDRPTLMKLVLDHGQGEDTWALRRRRAVAPRSCWYAWPTSSRRSRRAACLVIDELDTSLHPDLCKRHRRPVHRLTQQPQRGAAALQHARSGRPRAAAHR